MVPIKLFLRIIHYILIRCIINLSHLLSLIGGSTNGGVMYWACRGRISTPWLSSTIMNFLQASSSISCSYSLSLPCCLFFLLLAASRFSLLGLFFLYGVLFGELVSICFPLFLFYSFSICFVPLFFSCLLFLFCICFWQCWYSLCCCMLM